MKVLNTHSRKINQPKARLARLLSTLATKEDRIFPYEKWPPMRFKQGLKVGAVGGHGPIRYFVKRLEPERLIEFEFTDPRGFIGGHKFELIAQNENSTELKHSILMQTYGMGTLKWILGIRALHDALLEDALDKVENQFSEEKKETKWSLWVKILRKLLK